jgi:CheY-like chemotaxis protein
MMSRILIVEDNLSNRELLVQLLEDLYTLDVAGDGQEAIERVEQRHPDAILLDLSLPVLDGWAVARRLKADDSTRTIPIIALTAHAMAGDRERALEAGCDDYSAKPIQEEILFALLQKHLNSKAAP